MNNGEYGNRYDDQQENEYQSVLLRHFNASLRLPRFQAAQVPDQSEQHR